MIRHSFAQRAVIAVSFMGILPLLLLGCPKKPPPPVEVPDAAPAPEVDSAPTVLTPLDEMDAGDGGEAEAPKHTYHPPVNGNAAAIKQCCGALRTQAKTLGTSPEANVLIGLSVQCEQFAMAATTGNAPEFAQLRSMLKGRSLPAACQAIK
jgi:hypothetical protein